jgi:hypothetical protein
MAVPLSNTTLRVPGGFQGLLEGMAKEVLQMQPNDIYAFAAVYFENLLQIREEVEAKKKDAASNVQQMNDRFYNNNSFQNSTLGEDIEESENAAVVIQTKYRQHQAKSSVDEMRRSNAAVKIQSAARGFLARKRVKHLRLEHNSMKQDDIRALANATDSDEDQELQDLMLITQDEDQHELVHSASAEHITEQVTEGLEAPPELEAAPITNELTAAEPAKDSSAYVSSASAAAAKSRELDLECEEVSNAVDKIQAGFKSAFVQFEARMNTAAGNGEQTDEVAVTDEEHNENDPNVNDSAGALQGQEEEPSTEYHELAQGKDEGQEQDGDQIINAAAAKIQAGFHGMKTRRQMKGQHVNNGAVTLTGSEADAENMGDSESEEGDNDRLPDAVWMENQKIVENNHLKDGGHLDENKENDMIDASHEEEEEGATTGHLDDEERAMDEVEKVLASDHESDSELNEQDAGDGEDEP